MLQEFIVLYLMARISKIVNQVQQETMARGVDEPKSKFLEINIFKYNQ